MTPPGGAAITLTSNPPKAPKSLSACWHERDNPPCTYGQGGSRQCNYSHDPAILQASRDAKAAEGNHADITEEEGEEGSLAIVNDHFEREHSHLLAPECGLAAEVSYFPMDPITLHDIHSLELWEAHYAHLMAPDIDLSPSDCENAECESPNAFAFNEDHPLVPQSSWGRSSEIINEIGITTASNGLFNKSGNHAEPPAHGLHKASSPGQSSYFGPVLNPNAELNSTYGSIYDFLIGPYFFALSLLLLVMPLLCYTDPTIYLLLWWGDGIYPCIGHLYGPEMPKPHPNRLQSPYLKPTSMTITNGNVARDPPAPTAFESLWVFAARICHQRWLGHSRRAC